MQEAKPLIAHYGLKKVSGYHLNVFRKDEITLVVTGMGVFEAASAIGLLGQKNMLVCNVGVAGHRNLRVGEMIVAHKIQFHKLVAFPKLLFDLPCETKDVESVLWPQTNYETDSVYDMEAFGVYRSAMGFSFSEQISLCKVISDNAETPFTKDRRKEVSGLIEKNLSKIDLVVQGLMSLPQIDVDVDISWYTNKMHFTETQKEMLKKCFRQAQALGVSPYCSGKSAKEVLAFFSNLLGEQKLCL